MKTCRIDTAISNMTALFLFLFVAGFFFSTLLTSITSIALAVIWVVTKQYRNLMPVLSQQPFIVVGVALFLCFFIAMSYSPVSSELAESNMSKYRKLLYIPILMTFFREQNALKWAWAGFVAASFLTLLFSYLKWGGILDLNDDYASPTIKNRITHSMYVAFFAYYCLVLSNQPGKYRYIYFALILVALHNLFFVVDGRTGQMMAVGLVALYAYQRYSIKWFGVVVLLMALLIGGFLKYSNKADRINLGIENTLGAINEGAGKQRYTDLEIRYAFWRYSSALMEEKPVFGHGTGSFKSQLNRVAKNHAEVQDFDHPHNEFFKVGVELGAVGLIIYIGFYLGLFLQLKNLSGDNKLLAQGVLLSLFVVSIYNCPLYDHAQGNWFVTLIALCFMPENLIFKKEANHA